MRKGKIFIRIIMLIFIIAFPVYQLYTLGREYREIRKEDLVRRKALTERVREDFLLREETFYRDREYKKKFEKLYREK